MRENIIGQRFNRLVVIEDDGTRSSKGEIKWLCQCDCGNLYHALGYRLRNGRTKSCGCRHGASKDYMDSIRDPESLKSTKPTARSSTGVRGVYFNKRKKRYQVFIDIDKRQKYLGSYVSLEEAAKIRREAELKYGYKQKQ